MDVTFEQCCYNESIYSLHNLIYCIIPIVHVSDSHIHTQSYTEAQYLAQGHFDVQPGQPENRTNDLQILWLSSTVKKEAGDVLIFESRKKI